jgi:hypothetical protein
LTQTLSKRERSQFVLPIFYLSPTSAMIHIRGYLNHISMYLDTSQSQSQSYS